MLTSQCLVLEAIGGALHQLFGFKHASWADIAAGLATGSRTKQMQATCAQKCRVGLGCRVAPHGLVHCGGQGHDGVGGQYQSG